MTSLFCVPSGELQYKTGDLYSGGWSDGKHHGDGENLHSQPIQCLLVGCATGVVKYKNGDFYTGTWVNGDTKNGMLEFADKSKGSIVIKNGVKTFVR